MFDFRWTDKHKEINSFLTRHICPAVQLFESTDTICALYVNMCVKMNHSCKTDVFLNYLGFFASDYVNFLNTCKTSSDTFIWMVQKKIPTKPTHSLCLSVFSSFHLFRAFTPSLFLFLTLSPCYSVIHVLTHCHYINLQWSPSSAHTFVHIFKHGYRSKFFSFPLPAECKHLCTFTLY